MSLDDAEFLSGNDLIMLRAWLLDPRCYITQAHTNTVDNVHTFPAVEHAHHPFAERQNGLAYNDKGVLRIGANQELLAQLSFIMARQITACTRLINTACRELGTPGIAYSEVDPNDSDTCIPQLCLEGRPLSAKAFAIAQPLTLLAYRAAHPDYLLP